MPNHTPDVPTLRAVHRGRQSFANPNPNKRMRHHKGLMMHIISHATLDVVSVPRSGRGCITKLPEKESIIPFLYGAEHVERRNFLRIPIKSRHLAHGIAFAYTAAYS